MDSYSLKDIEHAKGLVQKRFAESDVLLSVFLAELVEYLADVHHKRQDTAHHQEKLAGGYYRKELCPHCGLKMVPAQTVANMQDAKEWPENAVASVYVCRKCRFSSMSEGK